MSPAPQDGYPSLLSLPHATTSVAEARRRVTAALSLAGLPGVTVDDVALVVSELVTNSLRHARPLPGGTIEVSWAVGARPTGPVRLAVRDGGGTTRPVAAQAPLSALGGRGLGIVGTVADAWGVEQDDTSTTVWAEVRPHARARGARGGTGVRRAAMI
jgi:anti-sigma regulatory factor (Ser/Thr protein kinase)